MNKVMDIFKRYSVFEYTELHFMIPKDLKVKIAALRTKYGATFYGRQSNTVCSLGLVQNVH